MLVYRGWCNQIIILILKNSMIILRRQDIYILYGGGEYGKGRYRKNSINVIRILIM